ncbi:MAG TPA: hypothetical protein DET40_16420 [Lentisphaeria bacterium]|nr:MAG: hypothetical protein A2X45_01000 [Lentisphaerae bacterium GWF2_50_93]HCE45127.1 hypothetical protein [Lentisphaeria bacterium]
MDLVRSNPQFLSGLIGNSSKAGICSKYTKMLVLVFLLSLSFGCNSYYHVLRAEPARQTSFLPQQPKLREMPPTFPFRRFWFNPAVDISKYSKMMISKVSTEHVISKNPWERVNESEMFYARAKECTYCARYIQYSFRNAVAGDPRKRFQLTSTPDAQTIVLELSLVQIVPSKSFFNVVESVAGFFVPGVGLLTFFNSGEIAIEGRLKDAESGTLVCMFAEREKDRIAIFDAAGLWWYRHTQNNIDDWGREFVLILNSKKRTDVRHRLPMVLVDW